MKNTNKSNVNFINKMAKERTCIFTKKNLRKTCAIGMPTVAASGPIAARRYIGIPLNATSGPIVAYRHLPLGWHTIKYRWWSAVGIPIWWHADDCH